MFSGNVDIDTIILSYVDDLNILPKNKYIDDILNNQNFWKLRLYNIHVYNNKYIIDYKSVVQFLDSTDDKLDQKYYLADKDICEQMMNLEINNNPLYLLTHINITLKTFKSLSILSYDNFLYNIVNLTKQNLTRLLDANNVRSEKSNNHLYLLSDLHNYLNEIIYKNDDISVGFLVNPAISNHTEYFYIIKLNNEDGFTNGRLLYELAKNLPDHLVIYDTMSKLIFDGLYYDDGIYYMLNYTNNLFSDGTLYM